MLTPFIISPEELNFAMYVLTAAAGVFVAVVALKLTGWME